MAFLYIAALVLTLVALSRKRRLESVGETKAFGYALTRSSLEFLIPLDIVLAIYGFVYLVLPSQWEAMPIESLIRWEQRLETLRTVTGGLRLSAAAIFAVLFALWLLGLGRPDVRRVRERTRDTVVKTNRWISRGYVLLVLLGSFTLLGTRAGPISEEVRLKIKLTREGYASLRNDIDQALSEEVAYRAAERALNEMAPEYRDVVASTPAVEKGIQELSAVYAAARDRYRITSPAADGVIRASAVVVEVSERRRMLRRGEAARSSSPQPPPRVTLADVQAARKQISQFREERHARSTWFISTEGSRDLIVHVPKLVTYATKTAILGSWKTSYPILEPLVDVVTKAIDERAEHAIDRRVDALRDAVLAEPKKAPVLLEEEALRIAADGPSAASEEMKVRTGRATEEAGKRLRAIESARTDVARRTAAAQASEIDRAIAQLSSNNSDMRESAVSRLNAMGEHFEKRHVERLTRLARSDSPSWTEATSREGHCTWYEETSVRYYAGRVLRDSSSPHIDERTTQLARRACDDGQRQYKVTDPGWI
ncbi:MAG: hypothetical protein ACXW5U_07330 [Thermoanaerobaculia bacterium]